MTRHTAPRAEADRVCVTCGVLKAAERFPQDAQRRRRRVCETCVAAKFAPKPCVRCGEPTLPAGFAVLADGRRSKYCVSCKTHGGAPQHCRKCNTTKVASAFRKYKNGGLSVSCEACILKANPDHTCIKCKRTLPDESFHRYHSNTRAMSCHECRTPWRQTEPGLKLSPNPCKQCGGPILFDLPPYQLRRRKHCSQQCDLMSRRIEMRTCSRCDRTLPFSAFDQSPSGRQRRKACRQCYRIEQSRAAYPHNWQLGVKYMAMNMRRTARAAKKPYKLRMQDVRRLHGLQCVLCGGAVSSVALIDPAGGFVMDNCRPTCRLCARLLRLAPWGEIVMHTNQVASYTPLDPDKLGGCARCRCTKSKTSATSKRPAAR